MKKDHEELTLLTKMLKNWDHELPDRFENAEKMTNKWEKTKVAFQGLSWKVFHDVKD